MKTAIGGKRNQFERHEKAKKEELKPHLGVSPIRQSVMWLTFKEREAERDSCCGCVVAGDSPGLGGS